MLILNNISVIYHGIKALNDLSITAYNDDFITIIGHNGAGKSTLIKSIEGRVMVDAGSIFLDNLDITRCTIVQRASFISTLHQNTKLGSIHDMTVEENVALALYKGKNATLDNGLKILEKHPAVLAHLEQLFPHKDIKKEKVVNLSGGERQMLAFLMATAIPPRLLLLDEPTAALDPAAAERMLEFITIFVRHHRIITIMITHDLETALSQGNKIWIINHGKIIHEINIHERQLSVEQLKLMMQ